MNLREATTPGGDPLVAHRHHSSDQFEEMLLREMPVIDKAISQACRRYRISPVEAEDFTAYAWIKLIENDFSLMRRFQGRGSLSAYLTTVITRLLLDFRVGQWGRWRPCTEAVQRGRPGVILDRLLHRDRLTFDEACTVIQTNYGLDISRDDLYNIATKLPARPSRCPASLTACTLSAADGCPDTAFQRQEAIPIAHRMKSELKAAIATLSDEDRRILELRFRDGHSVVEIATLLGLTPKPLYRRLERIARSLRLRVAKCGSSRSLDLTAFTLSGVSISW